MCLCAPTPLLLACLEKYVLVVYTTCFVETLRSPREMGQFMSIAPNIDLMLGHIKLKFPKVDVTLNTEAYRVLKSFRNRK